MRVHHALICIHRLRPSKQDDFESWKKQGDEPLRI